MALLNYPLVFVSSAAINYLTLYFVARKTKIGLQNLHTSKAFLVGDFFLIPLYFVVLARFVEKSLLYLNMISPVIIFAIVASAASVTFGFGIKFKLLNKVWIPHGVFHWFIVFSFLLVTYVVFVAGSGNLVEWAVLLILLFLHQFGVNKLGTKYLPVR